MIKIKHTDLLNTIADMQESIAYAASKNVLLMAEAVIVSLEADNAQLQAELAQAKHAEQQIREHEFQRGYQEAEAKYQAKEAGYRAGLEEAKEDLQQRRVNAFRGNSDQYGVINGHEDWLDAKLMEQP